MKKIITSIFILTITCMVYSQEYSVISRHNDTIRLYENVGGKAAKQLVSPLIPGQSTGDKENEKYRLIQKIENDHESYIFIDFSPTLDQLFIAYETGEGPSQYSTHVIGLREILEHSKRVNNISLKGSIFGMAITIFQRPSLFQDIINIDGFEFPLPIKLAVYESEMGKNITKQTEKSKQIVENEVEKNVNKVKQAVESLPLNLTKHTENILNEMKKTHKTNPLYDFNNDGIVDRNELLEIDAIVLECDKNSDGILSDAENTEFNKRIQMKRTTK